MHLWREFCATFKPWKFCLEDFFILKICLCRRQGDKDFTEEHRKTIGKAYEDAIFGFRDYINHVRDIDNQLQKIIYEVKEKKEEEAKKDESVLKGWFASFWPKTNGEIGYNSHENMNHILETRSRWAKSTHRCVRCSKFILSATQNSVDEKQLSHHPPDYHQN